MAEHPCGLLQEDEGSSNGEEVVRPMIEHVACFPLDILLCRSELREAYGGNGNREALWMGDLVCDWRLPAVSRVGGLKELQRSG